MTTKQIEEFARTNRCTSDSFLWNSDTRRYVLVPPRKRSFKDRYIDWINKKKRMGPLSALPEVTIVSLVILALTLLWRIALHFLHLA